MESSCFSQNLALLFFFGLASGYILFRRFRIQRIFGAILRGLFSIKCSLFGSNTKRIGDFELKDKEQSRSEKQIIKKPVNVAMMRHAQTYLIQY